MTVQTAAPRGRTARTEGFCSAMAVTVQTALPPDRLAARAATPDRTEMEAPVGTAQLAQVTRVVPAAPAARVVPSRVMAVMAAMVAPVGLATAPTPRGPGAREATGAQLR